MIIYILVIATVLSLQQAAVYAAPTLTSIRINEQLPTQGTIRLTVTGVYSDGSTTLIESGVAWLSLDTNIAVVDINGNVAFTGQRGAVTIAAYYDGKTASVSTNTQLAPSSAVRITIDGLPYNSQRGTTYPLIVQAIYIDNTAEVINNSYVTFESSSPAMASITSEGVVSVHGSIGAFVITAKYRDKIAVTTSVVNSNDWTSVYYPITLDQSGIRILGDIPKEPFQPRKLVAKAEYPDGTYRDLISTVTWTTSNSSVASITTDGTISFGGQYGVAIITAKSGNFEDKVTINIDRSLLIYEEKKAAVIAEGLAQSKQKEFFDDKIIDTDSIVESIKRLENARQNSNATKYIDIKNHWSEREIKIAEQLGIGKDLFGNSFKPDSNITRAEFAALVYQAFSVRYYIDDANKTFKDVSGQWYEDDIMALKNAGIISGYSDGTFKPNNNITRGEAIAIISRLIVKSDLANKNSGEKYKDVSSSYWAKKDIDKLYSLSALDMIGKDKLESSKSATRAEVVNMIIKLLMNIEQSAK